MGQPANIFDVITIQSQPFLHSQLFRYSGNQSKLGRKNFHGFIHKKEELVRREFLRATAVAASGVAALPAF